MARDCVKRIVEQSNGLFSEVEAKDLLREVDAYAKAKFSKGIDRNESVQQVLNSRMETALKNLQKEKDNLKRNVLIRKQHLDRLDRMVEAGASFSDLKNALMVGVNRQVDGAREAFEQMHMNVGRDVIGPLELELSEAGVMDMLLSGKFDDVIEKELWNFNANENARSITGNEQAYEAAKIVRRHQEALRKKLNYYGADVGRLDNYSTYRTHDFIKMMKATEDEWVKFVGKHIDVNRSFGGNVADMDEVLRDAYNALVTGVRLDAPSSDKDLFRFRGPGNLAKKVSSQRQIHFKSAEAEAEYRQRFGRSGSFRDNLFAGFDNNALNLAALRYFGPNPEAMITKLYDDVGKKYRSRKKKNGKNYIRGLDTERDQAISYYRGMMGVHSNADNVNLARFGVVVRTVQNLKLGAAGLASVFGDTIFKALAYRYNGRNIISSVGKSVADIGILLNGDDNRKFGILLNVMTDSYIGDTVGRFSLEEGLSPNAMRFNRLYFRLNGLTWLTRNFETAFQRTLAADLAFSKGMKFSDITNHEVLRTYGIADAEWAVYQNMIEKHAGYEFVNPQAIDRIGDEVVSAYKVASGSTKGLLALRDDLKTKLQMYYSDQASFAVLRGGERERQIWVGDSKAGTPIGEIRRLIAQFKQFPTAAATKVWSRSLYGKNGTDVAAIMYLLTLAPVFGYLQGAAKDIAVGKEPKDPMMPATVMDAFSRGGGLSILGETMLSFAESPLRSTVGLLGPSFGDAIKLGDVATGKDGASQRLMSSVTPNLWYTSLGINYLFAHEIKETLNPGYLRRMERNMKKYYNQEFYAKPK